MRYISSLGLGNGSASYQLVGVILISKKSNTQRSKDDVLPEAHEHAARFNQVREAHKTEATEDYVELIDDLIRVHGEARLVDVASRMGVTQPTASKTLARLQRDGFVSSEPYRSIFLTPEGKDLADESRLRHEVVLNFLLAIGVNKEAAIRDSEGMEHHVSEETLKVFKKVIREQSK